MKRLNSKNRQTDSDKKIAKKNTWGSCRRGWLNSDETKKGSSFYSRYQSSGTNINDNLKSSSYVIYIYMYVCLMINCRLCKKKVVYLIRNRELVFGVIGNIIAIIIIAGDFHF